MNKHGNCSKCKIVITQDNCNKGRTVCILCHRNHVLESFKNRFCQNSSPKTDASAQTYFSNKQDSSNKQERSIKQVKSSEQDSSNKEATSSKQDCSSQQDISTNIY